MPAIDREIIATVFEGAPRFVDRLSSQPFESWEQLIASAQAVALSMPDEEQIELVNSHPRIGADPATVSATSFREQGYDRDPATEELQSRLDELNGEYERRFGFRFVVFVAGRPRSEIADLMAERMSANRTEELERALSDVFAIARDRLKKAEAR